jgi:hypothetical protein
MSKERELLKRVRDTLHELKETHYDLYWDIQAELNQPKREPLNPEFRERISKAYGTKSEQKAFEEGIIFAEMSHKIGVEND